MKGKTFLALTLGLKDTLKTLRKQQKMGDALDNISLIKATTEYRDYLKEKSKRVNKLINKINKKQPDMMMDLIYRLYDETVDILQKAELKLRSS